MRVERKGTRTYTHLRSANPTIRTNTLLNVSPPARTYASPRPTRNVAEDAPTNQHGPGFAPSPPSPPRRAWAHTHVDQEAESRTAVIMADAEDRAARAARARKQVRREQWRAGGLVR